MASVEKATSCLFYPEVKWVLYITSREKKDKPERYLKKLSIVGFLQISAGIAHTGYIN